MTSLDVLGYVRVSTDQQGESGLGLEAQTATIRAECERRDWTLRHLYREVGSGGSVKRRPELAAALAQLHAGEAQALVVAKLDRLSRSLIDFADITKSAHDEGWAIVALDIGVDTTTPHGEMVASIIMALAQWERRMIGQRTKDALGALQARGTRLGRPVTLAPEAEAVIRAMTAAGVSLADTARALNDAKIPTSQGGTKWRSSSVAAISARLARE
jgi:DNA invertase Pin-like site-specific DNA recombinase